VLGVGAAGLVATVASAQSPYVAVTVGSDVSRFDSSTFTDTLRVDGEARSFAARAGTPLGESWGIEVEVVYPTRNSRERVQDSPIVINPTLRQPQVTTSLSMGPSGTTPRYHVGVKRHNPTADVSAWLAHHLRDGVQLRYLAGIAMHRFAQVTSVSVLPIPGVRVSSSQLGERREIGYGVGPMAGIEARFIPTGRLFAAAGLRLHGFSAGWILRPSAGLGWTF
jgi:hypothetical protein